MYILYLAVDVIKRCRSFFCKPIKVLQKEGYIREFEVTDDEKGKQLEIFLKYFDNFI